MASDKLKGTLKGPSQPSFATGGPWRGPDPNHYAWARTGLKDRDGADRSPISWPLNPNADGFITPHHGHPQKKHNLRSMDIGRGARTDPNEQRNSTPIVTHRPGGSILNSKWSTKDPVFKPEPDRRGVSKKKGKYPGNPR